MPKKFRRFIKIFKIISPEFIFGVAGIVFLVVFFTISKFLPIATPTKKLPPPVTPKAFQNLSLEAQAVFVYDINSRKEIFSNNGDAQLPLASLTKIMMAVTAISLLPNDTVVTIDQNFLKEEGDSGLYANEQWRLGDLLDLTLLESSNDGASAVAAVAASSGRSPVSDAFGQGPFIDAMNRKATELGLSQTYFLNPTGLDQAISISGAYGSARDMALLFSYAITTYPRTFGVTRLINRELQSISSIKHQVKNTNLFVDNIPSLLASKTGYTDLAGGNLVIAFDAGPNRPIVISVLGSTEKGRFEDVEKLVWSTLEYLSEHNL